MILKYHWLITPDNSQHCKIQEFNFTPRLTNFNFFIHGKKTRANLAKAFLIQILNFFKALAKSRKRKTFPIDAFIMIYSHKPLLTFFTNMCHIQHSIIVMSKTLWAYEHNSINQMLFWLAFVLFPPSSLFRVFTAEKRLANHSVNRTAAVLCSTRLTFEWCRSIEKDCKQLLSFHLIHACFMVRLEKRIDRQFRKLP